MKRFSEQLKKKSQNIRMLKSEQRDLRERVVSYMEYHPMPKAQGVTATKKNKQAVIVSEPFTTIKLNMRSFRSFAGVFTMILMVGIPVVAERAVPGDVLYPVKVQFNEEVRSSLSFSPYAKVEWETERLERRLAEARLLADAGKLTEAIEAEVALAVQNHSDAAQLEIATLRRSDSDGAALAQITFASALDVQSEVLASRGLKDGEGGRTVAALVGAVADARSGVARAQGESTPSYEKLLARIEVETTRAQELFTSVKTDASPEEVANIERRLADIQRKVVAATEVHNRPNEVAVATNTESDDLSDDVAILSSVASGSDETISASSAEASALAVSEALESMSIRAEEIPVDTEAQLKEAITTLSAALTDVRKLISFMTDIDVHSNVTIEELLPVTLTKEERFARVDGMLFEASQKNEELKSLAVKPAFAEKFTLGKSQLGDFIIKTQEALQAGELLRAESLVTSANEIADDLFKMTTYKNEPEVVIEVTATTSESAIDNERSTTSSDVAE